MIREANADDTPRLLEMALHFIASTPYAMFPADEDSVRALIETVFEQGVIYVAEDMPESRHLIGMIALVPAVMLTNVAIKYAEEIVWWVEPDRRAGFTGPRLLEHAMAWARARSLHYLKMVAPAGSDVGVYYERLGFRSVENAYIIKLS